MKTRAIGIAAAFVAGLILCGCERFKLPARKPAAQPDADGAQARPPGKKFIPPKNEGMGPQLKEQLDKELKIRKQLEGEKQALEEENKKLSAEVAGLKTDLARANRDIDEANAMMLKLEKRLGDWKKNVLGYRAEIMAGLHENRQLLRRCVKALGVEMPVEVPPTSAPATQPAKATTQPAPSK